MFEYYLMFLTIWKFEENFRRRLISRRCHYADVGIGLFTVLTKCSYFETNSTQIPVSVRVCTKKTCDRSLTSSYPFAPFQSYIYSLPCAASPYGKWTNSCVNCTTDRTSCSFRLDSQVIKTRFLFVLWKKIFNSLRYIFVFLNRISNVNCLEFAVF